MDNKSIWNEKWDRLAEYSRQSAGNKWAFYLIKKLLKKAEIDSGYIVDIGCGMGNKTSVLAQYYRKSQIYGIDFSKEGIDHAKKFYNNIKNLHFKCSNIDVLSEKMKNKKIMMVTSFEVLEHIEKWEDFLDKICNLTSKYVLLSVPTGNMRKYEIGLGHYRNFKKGEIESYMFRKGFKKVDVLYAGFPFWSPFTRDMMNRIGHQDGEKLDSTLNSFHPLVHSIIYILYRFLSFNRIGDQFVGLFERNTMGTVYNGKRYQS